MEEGDCTSIWDCGDSKSGLMGLALCCEEAEIRPNGVKTPAELPIKRFSNEETQLLPQRPLPPRFTMGLSHSTALKEPQTSLNKG